MIRLDFAGRCRACAVGILVLGLVDVDEPLIALTLSMVGTLANKRPFINVVSIGVVSMQRRHLLLLRLLWILLLIAYRPLNIGRESFRLRHIGAWLSGSCDHLPHVIFIHACPFRVRLLEASAHSGTWWGARTSTRWCKVWRSRVAQVTALRHGDRLLMHQLLTRHLTLMLVDWDFRLLIYGTSVAELVHNSTCARITTVVLVIVQGRRG